MSTTAAEKVEEKQEEQEQETTEETTSQEEESTETEDSTSTDEEDISGLLSALRKERDNNKELKNELRQLKQQDESEAEKAAREAAEKAEAKYKKALADTHARSMLLEMGVRENPDRFLKMIDQSKVYVNDDGNVVGIKDQINEIKRDFPEVFNPKTPTPSVDQGEKKPVDSDKKLSSAERIALRYNGEE